MNKKHLVNWLIPGIILLIIFGIALYIRIIPAYDHIFVGNWIKFAGNDAWYHMRIVDNLVHNFPEMNWADPYLLYGGVMKLPEFAFFDYSLSFQFSVHPICPGTALDLATCFICGLCNNFSLKTSYLFAKSLFRYK